MVRKVRLTKAGTPDRRGGKRPGAGRKKGGPGGRRKIYGGETTSIMLYTTKTRAKRIQLEARKLGISRNQLFNMWAEGLPPTPDEIQEQ